MPSRFGVALVAWCLGIALLTAQSDRISIRLVPKPASTVHYRFTHEVALDISPDAPAAGSVSIPPITTRMKMNMACTQVNGSRDAEGQLESQMTCDEVDASMTLNGQPMPGGLPAGQMAGFHVTLKYDDQGKVVDVQMPSDLPATSGIPMKQLITAFSNVLPPVTLGIGETTSVPLDLPLPMPAAGGSASPALQGRTVLKLLSVERENAREGADRIAHFESTTDVSVNNSDSTSASTGPLPGVKLDFRVNAKGTLDANLDGGFIRTNQTEGTFDGTVSPQGAGGMPAMRLTGTLKMAMTGAY